MIWHILGFFGTVAGVGYGLVCRRELKKWAYQCQNARIAVAYKRKVKLQAPLVEWLTWINMLDKDQASNGRTVYTMGGTTVAIIRAPDKAKQPEQRK